MRVVAVVLVAAHMGTAIVALLSRSEQNKPT